MGKSVHTLLTPGLLSVADRWTKVSDRSSTFLFGAITHFVLHTYPCAGLLDLRWPARPCSDLVHEKTLMRVATCDSSCESAILRSLKSARGRKDSRIGMSRLIVSSSHGAWRVRSGSLKLRLGMQRQGTSTRFRHASDTWTTRAIHYIMLSRHYNRHYLNMQISQVWLQHWSMDESGSPPRFTYPASSATLCFLCRSTR